MRLLLLLSLSIIVFSRNINSYPLRNWDEAWYAQISKNMASGNYTFLMPFWNGRYYFDHAPLYFWLTAPIVKIFGSGEWQFRLVSAQSAVVATILVYLITKKLFSQKIALLSVAIFLTMGQVVVRFSQGNLDSLLIALNLAAFYFYLLNEKQKRFAIICGLALGLGVLVKSWGTGLFPLMLIFLFSALKNKSLPKNLKYILPVAALSFVWWYLWGIKSIGRDFLNWYILNPSEGRLNNPLQNFSLSYFGALIRDIGFWFFPLVLSISLFFKKIKENTNPAIISFLLLSTFFIFFLNFFKDKSDWYNLPTYPFLAITLAYFLYFLVEKYKKITPIFLFIILIFQTLNVIRIENISPDRSKVGADLGTKAAQIIPKGAKIILDDHDFTSFLYYSGQVEVFTIEEDKESDFTEWWKITNSDVESFLSSNPNAWLITPNPQKFRDLDVEYQTTLDNYYFLKVKDKD